MTGPEPDDDDAEREQAFRDLHGNPDTTLHGYARSPARRDTPTDRTIHDVLETL